MDKEYRAKDISDEDDEEKKVLDKCADFEALEAYVDPEKIEESLTEYWGNRGMGQSKLGAKAWDSSSVKMRRWDVSLFKLVSFSNLVYILLFGS